jgi:hypothetical protein
VICRQTVQRGRGNCVIIGRKVEKGEFAMTKRRESHEDVFSAVEIVNRRAEKELEGYSRAFAVRDRLTAGSAQSDESQARGEQPPDTDGE